MEEHIKELFEKAVYLDKSDIWKDPKYQEVARRQLRIYKQLRLLCGPKAGDLLQEHTLALADEWEMEIFFFFRQGYLMAKKESTDQEKP